MVREYPVDCTSGLLGGTGTAFASVADFVGGGVAGAGGDCLVIFRPVVGCLLLSFLIVGAFAVCFGGDIVEVATSA